MKILIFGGTFDPVHRGHLKMADELQSALEYDEVWFIPCQSSRYGKTTVPFEDRMNMLNAGFDDICNPAFIAMDTEIQCGAEGRMFVLAEYLAKTYPDAEMEFLIGSDSLQHIQTWYRSSDLLSRHMMIVAERAGYPDKRLEGHLHFPMNVVYNTSSTDARSQIAQNGCSPMLTLGVQKYIKEHNLYGS
jgi:nicotinate-nucleotide adenylyltransferase